MNVMTEQGSTLSLIEPALASGGEGAVYRIQGYPNKLVKIYSKVEEARSREEKIRAMVRIGGDINFQRTGILKDISWPLASIYDSQHNFIGFGMNAIGDGLKLDDVYDYPPKANANICIQDKIKCLISMCDIITKLHDSGNEFGDFNPENIMVNKDMTVGFIDADSYHLHIDGKTYRCIVCAPGYVAPEIIRKTKGTTYEACPGITFTKQSDYFGLAVHCFCMLMNGCHPFKCAKHKSGQGSSVTIKPIDLRVERGETPFFKSVSGVQTPDWAPRIDDLPDYLINMFKRAFIDGHNNPDARPNEKEWKAVLIKYGNELRQCSKQRIHQYWMGKQICPYCEAINRKNPVHYNLGVPAGNMTNTVKNTVNNVIGTVNSGSKSNSFKPTYNSQINKIAAKNNMKFSIITMILSIMLSIAELCVYYQYFYGLSSNEEWIICIIVWAGAIAGLVGTWMYNAKWSTYARGGCIHFYDYFFSLLCGVGFGISTALACFLAVAVICITLVIISYAVAIIFILVVLVGLLGG